MVSHDLGVVKHIADRIMVFMTGMSSKLERPPKCWNVRKTTIRNGWLTPLRCDGLPQKLTHVRYSDMG